MVWLNTYFFAMQSYANVTMKDNEISMEEMSLLIIQYIMHKKWWYENQREKIFSGSERKQEQYFREKSTDLKNATHLISLILVVPIYIVL